VAPRSEILSVVSKLDGTTHIVFDHAVDTRVQVVAYTDQAHVLLGLNPQEWMHEFAAHSPHRMTEVTG